MRLFPALFLVTFAPLILEPLAHGQEKSQPRDPYQHPFANPIDNPDLPRVLLIGDSISIGYTPRVRRLLKDQANVHRPGTNCQWSAHGDKKIEEWVGETKWDVIHFNLGLWDWYGWKQEPKATPESYARSLESIVTKLKEKTDATLIFAMTTPPCIGPEKKVKFVVSEERAMEFNTAAREVMERHGVKINDLYELIFSDREKYQRGKDDVHYNEEGRDRLAQQVATEIKEELSGPPNILFIYTDDQSTRTVSCYDEAYPWVNTPNIDALAASGVRFEHAYIGAWCMPSRASLLTGLQQHGIESMRMEGKYPGSTYDPEECRFWPSVFRENGYTTAHIGKWHTGTDDGFGRDWDYQIIWNRPKYVENSPRYYYDQLIVKNGGEPEKTEGYSTDNYTNWAVDYIHGEGRDPEKPWYLWLCYGAVHGPFTPADRHLDDYPDAVVPVPADIYPPRPDKPKYIREMEFWEPGKDGQPVERKARENSPVGMKDMPGRSLRDWVRQYQQGVLAIDEGVGRLLTALKESGQDENTLIVFTSDQGFAWGQKGFKSKVAPYRANVEAPMIVRMPAKVAAQSAGRVIEEPISGVDIVPTFFTQAGIDLPWEMHGFDLSPLLGAENKKWDHPALLVHTGKLYGSDSDQVPAADDPKLYHGPGIPWYVMLCEGDYKYIRNLVPGETEELYHMGDDPEELVNLAQLAANQTVLKKFREQAIEELRRTKAGMVDRLPAVGTPVK